MSYRDGKRLNRMESRANSSSCRYPQLPAGTKVGERSCATVTPSRQILVKDRTLNKPEASTESTAMARRNRYLLCADTTILS